MLERFYFFLVTTRRNMGGRRPKHPSNLSPEEEAKRKVRRERNKLAAGKNFFLIRKF